MHTRRLGVSPGSIGVEQQRASRKWPQRPVSWFSAIAEAQPTHCTILGRSLPCSGWKFHRTVTVSQQQQTSQSSRKLAELRLAIGSATSHEELQARVQKLFGPNAGLSPSELRTPMPELRQQLLARAEQASTQLMQRIEAQAARKPDSLVKETLRIAISAAAYAIGFAFLAGVLPRGQAAGMNRGVDDDYFQKLAR